MPRPFIQSRRLLSRLTGMLVLIAPSIAFGQAPETASNGVVHAKQNIFVPMSAAAEEVLGVSWLVTGICTAIFAIVAGLLTYAIIKFRSKPGEERLEPPQIYGSFQIELAWTIIPIMIVFLLALVTARTIGTVQARQIPADAVKIKVIGRQWWWEIHYLSADGKTTEMITANELHVPVNKVTHLYLQSADVVHAFWVPALAGKTDLIPNHTNEMWIEPNTLGTFLGNCAEYCGTQHANMLLRVVVDDQAGYDKWLAAQKAPPVEDTAVAAGKDTFFRTSCINCHAVDGTIAKGVFGPDLTHMMSRQTIAAGVAPLNKETLREWLRDPQEMKHGNLMPNMQLTEKELDDITEYLASLK
ncbi:MAG TPA: cytochrome c oxidase subunit II [Chthoniobacterales bacterium]